MLGGSYGDWSSSSGGGNPSIVFQGRAFQTWTKANQTGPGSVTYLQSYDIRTGQLYFERPIFPGEATPSAIEYDPGHGEVPGSGDSPLGLSQSLIGFSSGRMYKYSLWTGAMTANYSIAPLTTATYEMNGYALGIQTIGTQYRLINFTTFNNYQSTTNPLNALNVVSNITWPWNTIGMLDLQSGYAAQMSSITPPAVGAFYGTWIRGANLLTGVQTFNITDPGTLYSGSCTVADHGKVAGLMMGGYFKAWDLATGKLAWQGQAMAYPWSQPAFGAYSIQSAYGLFYREAYDGVYAFKWTDGSIAWRFAAPANPYETPYTDVNGSGVYSFNAGGILADGKIFVYNTEHTPSQPITRGWRLFCVDAKTGAGIWNITGTMSPGVIADGYLTASNGYDGYMYVFGKGKSAATVTATPAVIANGATVLVQGTVMDQSPAQPNTPCVSKDSMTTQMEYLHMQLPVDGIWHNVSMTGVPVLLTAIDSSGAVTSIGTVTTNPYYGTFSMPWTPSKQDTYIITASFAGDDSYGSSSAAAAVNVGPAPQTANPTTQPAQTVDNTPLYYAVAGAAVAIILAIAIATVLILRKK